ncbi:Abi family protein [Pseudomonas sp. R3-41]
MRFLEVVTLFRLSPYMRPFQEPGPEHTFKPGSTLKAIVDIYRFDGSLRRITMDAIERVEVAIRAVRRIFQQTPDARKTYSRRNIPFVWCHHTKRSPRRNARALLFLGVHFSSTP